MKERGWRLIGILVIVAVLISANGCALRLGARLGKLRTESETVELGDAKSVRVDISMGAGELDVTGGADELLEADFTYNVDEFKPEVKYSGSTLIVRQPEVRVGVRSLASLGDYRYEWDLRLNDDVPIDMEIDLGAGEADLVLGSLSLTRLDIARGAGELRVDLSGASSLTRLDIDGGAGRLTLDLTGDWQNDLKARIEGGVGEKTLRLPTDVGVRVEVETGVGSVDARGLRKEGNVYTNDAYGESDVTLDVDLEVGVGAVDLELDR